MSEKLKTSFETKVNENNYTSHGKTYTNKYLNIPKKGTPRYDDLKKGDKFKVIIIKCVANKEQVKEK